LNTDVKNITALRLEVLTDSSLPAMGPGRAGGNFVLNEIRVKAADQKTPEKAQKVVLQKALADFSQNGFNVAAAIDNNPQTGWAISPQVGKAHVAIFELRKPINNPNGTILTIELDQQFTGKLHNLGRFRLSVTTAKPPVQLNGGIPDAILKLLDIAPEQRTPEQKGALALHYRSIDSELARLGQALADLPRPTDKRLLGAQDLAWALLNSPAFLFNH
jgi:hypothetical protein